MANPIHILHLHSSFAPGGKEMRSVRLMNAFGDKARHTIVSGVPGQLGARDHIAKGISYQIAQDPPPLTGKPSVARYEAIARYMRRFDLVLTYNWGAIDGVMARRAFPKDAPPVVHHEDGFNEDEAERLNPLRNMYRRIALNAAHALVVPSAVLERIALKAWHQPQSRVRVIGNGIPVERYGKPLDPRAIPGFRRKDGEIVVGSLAGFRAVKNLPMLVSAMAGLLHVKARLVLVGDGPEKQAILDMAERLGLADEVHLPGFLPEPWRYMGLFDIFALSSTSEQQPIAVMEAMAAGLPVAATRVGDIEAMVAPENEPYLADNINAVHLRDSIQVFAQNPDLRISVGKANQARAAAMFDEKRMIERYGALYSEAMGQPGLLG